MNNEQTIDAILYLDPDLIKEAADPRSLPGKHVLGYDTGPGGTVNWDDPKLYMSTNFGKQLQNSLNSIGNGFWAEVSDFGKYVTVTVGHHNTVSGRSSTKHFVIVFQKDGIGTIFTSATKWRTISGVSQAASYIKSLSGAIESSSANKL